MKKCIAGLLIVASVGLVPNACAKGRESVEYVVPVLAWGGFLANSAEMLSSKEKCEKFAKIWFGTYKGKNIFKRAFGGDAETWITILRTFLSVGCLAVGVHDAVRDRGIKNGTSIDDDSKSGKALNITGAVPDKASSVPLVISKTVPVTVTGEAGSEIVALVGNEAVWPTSVTEAEAVLVKSFSGMSYAAGTQLYRVEKEASAGAGSSVLFLVVPQATDAVATGFVVSSSAVQELSAAELAAILPVLSQANPVISQMSLNALTVDPGAIALPAAAAKGESKHGDTSDSDTEPPSSILTVTPPPTTPTKAMVGDPNEPAEPLTPLASFAEFGLLPASAAVSPLSEGQPMPASVSASAVLTEANLSPSLMVPLLTTPVKATADGFVSGPVSPKRSPASSLATTPPVRRKSLLSVFTTTEPLSSEREIANGLLAQANANSLIAKSMSKGEGKIAALRTAGAQAALATTVLEAAKKLDKAVKVLKKNTEPAKAQRLRSNVTVVRAAYELALKAATDVSAK